MHSETASCGAGAQTLDDGRVGGGAAQDDGAEQPDGEAVEQTRPDDHEVAECPEQAERRPLVGEETGIAQVPEIRPAQGEAVVEDRERRDEHLRGNRLARRAGCALTANATRQKAATGVTSSSSTPFVSTLAPIV